MNPAPTPFDAARRILVIKLRHHGDVLLASPVLSVLRTHYPQAQIDALVYAETAPMLDGHPALSQLHRIERSWKHRGIQSQVRAEWALLSKLRERRYDLVIHLTDHARGAWLTRLLRPRMSVAPQRAPNPWWWRQSFTHLYPQLQADRRHTVERNLDALRRIGIQPAQDDRALKMVPGQSAEQRVAALLAEHGLEPGRFIHLHAASRWRFKCWPVERNAALIRLLVAEGWKIVLTAAPDKAELKQVERIVQAANTPVTNLAGQLSLKEMAALTAAARLFIGVDSAPMHIAAAVGTPAVALFGPSSEQDWGPWQVRHEVIASTAHRCRPCGLDGCGGGKISECIVTLDEQRVHTAAIKLISEPIPGD